MKEENRKSKKKSKIQTAAAIGTAAFTIIVSLLVGEGSSQRGNCFASKNKTKQKQKEDMK